MALRPQIMAMVSSRRSGVWDEKGIR